jgi:hypothetical protein
MPFVVQKREAQSLLQNICESTRDVSKIKVPANVGASAVVSEVVYCVTE